MKILSIETSCDDTGISVLEVKENLPRGKAGKNSPDFAILANVIASQIEIGKKYGGVYPMMAKREHQKNLVPVLIKSLKESKLLKPETVSFLSIAKKLTVEKILEREPELLKKLVPFLKKYAKPDIDMIAVTNGPGLEPCLWVGVNFAKCLSYFWDIPVVPVNHIEGHILVNLLPNPSVIAMIEATKQSRVSAHTLDSGFRQNDKIKFPAIALVVSGGHTQIILIKKPFGTAQGKSANYEILGETRDDAAGECFDKCAKILGLGYPGGPIIAKLASQAVIPAKAGIQESVRALWIPGQARNDKISLPRPMINTKDYDFSFSGLKTAVLYAWKKLKEDKNSEFFGDRQKTHQLQADFSAEIQQAIIDVLIKKTIKAVKNFNAKSLILGGGVSANQEFRKQFARHCEQQRSNLNLIFPDPKLSTDNGLMIAVAGYFNKAKKIGWEKIQANGNLRIGE